MGCTPETNHELTAKYFKIWLICPEPLLPFFLHPSSYVFVHTWVTWPCFRVVGMALRLHFFHEVYFQPDPIDGCIWVPMFFGFFCQFWADDTAGFAWCSFHLLSSITVSTILNVCFFVHFQKTLTITNKPVCFEAFVCKDVADAV